MVDCAATFADRGQVRQDSAWAGKKSSLRKRLRPESFFRPGDFLRNAVSLKNKNSLSVIILSNEISAIKNPAEHRGVATGPEQRRGRVSTVGGMIKIRQSPSAKVRSEKAGKLQVISFPFH
jgi:hypothetical protein